MAQQTINVGSTANDGTGDKLRDAFVKANANFTELYSDDAGDVNSVAAGTGISVDQTTGAVTVTNSAPDQTVSLTGGTSISTSGTYPSFTITNDSPNATHTGDVTGSGALTIADDVISYAKLGTEFTTAFTVTGTNLDFGAYQVFTRVLSGTEVLTITNAEIGVVKDLYMSGGTAFSITNGILLVGDYSVTATTNLIQIVARTSSSFYYTITPQP
jgi:hypothetical protein